MTTALDPLVSLVTESEAYEIVGDTADADLIRTFANGISQHLQTMIGRTLINRSYTNEYYDGTGTDELVLRNRPVTAFSSLYVGLNAVTPLEQGIDKDFMVDLSSGIVTLLWGEFERGRYNVKANYSAGYLVADVPYDLKMAVKEAIAFLYAERGRIGISAISTPEQVTTYLTQAYPKRFDDIVSAYRGLLIA